MNSKRFAVPYDAAAAIICLVVIIATGSIQTARAAGPCDNMSDYLGSGPTLQSVPYLKAYTVPGAGLFGYTANPFGDGTYGDMWGSTADDSIYSETTPPLKIYGASRPNDCPDLNADVSVGPAFAEATTSLLVSLSSGIVSIPQAGALILTDIPMSSLWTGSFVSCGPYCENPIPNLPCFPDTGAGICKLYDDTKDFIPHEYFVSMEASVDPDTLRFTNGKLVGDAIIDEVQKTGHIVVQGTSMAVGDPDPEKQGTPGPASMSFPATNCLYLAGSGPNAIVFMRGKTASTSVASFLSMLNGPSGIIAGAFGAIDPYKTYLDQFTFYADLNDYDDSSFPTITGTFGFHFYDVDDYLKSATQCSGDKIDSYYTSADGSGVYSIHPPRSTSYVFYFHNPAVYDGWSPADSTYGNASGHLSYLDTHQDVSLDTVTLHEFGHAFANLEDEYLSPKSIWNSNVSILQTATKNCTTQPSWDYRAADNKIYGMFPYQQGCSTLYAGVDSKGHPISLYRPSTNGIMNNDYSASGRFSVIDCGYIVSAIFGEPANQTNAAKHWPILDTELAGTNGDMPGCSSPSMNTIDTGIPALNKATPSVSQNASASSGSSGASASVSGSNFTSTDNAVDLISSSGAVIDIPGLSSSDGTTLSFTIPTSTPVGPYMLKVGAFNSDWSNSIPFMVTAVVVKPLPTISLSATSNTVTTNQTPGPTLSWSATNATSCSFGMTPVNGSASLGIALQSGGPTGSYTMGGTSVGTTYIVSCSGPGGTAVSNPVTITVIPAVTVPVVSVTASPATITAGQPTTISWTAATSYSSFLSCAESETANGNMVPNAKMPAQWLAIGSQHASPIAGSMTFMPTATTTAFKLICYNAATPKQQGTGQATVTMTAPVVIVPPAPTVTIQVDPGLAVNPGDTVILSWTSSGATTCMLNDDKDSDFGGWRGPISISGQAKVLAASGGSPTIACTGPGGTAQQGVTITVGPDDAQPGSATTSMSGLEPFAMSSQPDLLANVLQSVGRVLTDMFSSGR